MNRTNGSSQLLCSLGVSPWWTPDPAPSSPPCRAYLASTTSGLMHSESESTRRARAPSTFFSRAILTTTVQLLMSSSEPARAAPACTSRAAPKTVSTCRGRICCPKVVPKCCCSMWMIEGGHSYRPYTGGSLWPLKPALNVGCSNNRFEPGLVTHVQGEG